MAAPSPGVPGVPPGIRQATGGFGGNVATIKDLLENRRTELKTAVAGSFKRVSGNGSSVDINGLLQIRLEIAQKLGLPESVFGPLEEDYIRFDFNGTGFLEVNEVYKLIKFALYDYLKSQNAHAANNIRFKSLQQSGFTVMRELGAGNQASLKLVCDQHGNQRCIKCFNKSSLFSAGSLSDLQDEFETMQLLACKNIARTFEIFQDAQFVYMVNEVYHGGDFTGLKQKATARLGTLTEDWWRQIFRQCFEALQFMHQQAMMHCDVKEPNLMMRTDNYANPQVVLIDFGISKAMTKDSGASVSGTPGYMPPETMNTGKWYPGGDVFSLGVTMYQLMADMVPDDESAKKGAPMIGLFLEGCTAIEHVAQAVNNRPVNWNRMPANMPGLKQLTMRALERNMRTRPKAPTLLKDPWFGNMVSSRAPEDSMLPQHPMATVGITEEMMSSVPGMQAPPPPAPLGRAGAPTAGFRPGGYGSPGYGGGYAMVR
jgi:serine/threonine protein kinase